jgi:outer membrane immunogenic protein
MRAYVIALASVAAVAVATPAAAEGFRAELHAGWDHADVFGDGDSGILYGVGLGYDFKVGERVFLGVEANLDDSTQKECESNVLVTNDRLCVKAGRDISAAVRVGTDVSEAGKIYALAGYTNARFKVRYTDASGTDSEGDNLDGFRLGAGYQHAIGSNTYAKLEYRYSNYEAGVERHQALVGFGVNF